MPGDTVTFTLGTQNCAAVTDSNGHAQCSFVVTQHPGSYTANASFAGDPAYNLASGSSGFTITQEESQLTYGGVLTSDYHDPVTASATLIDPVDGIPIPDKPITFTLGIGDSCSGTTNASGVASCVASCSINPTQMAATYPLVASFAGDIDYVSSSDSDLFVITREETTTTYTGPTVILKDASGVTLKAQLLEDGTVPPGQTITLSLGGQSCNATADASGTAQCSLTVTGRSRVGAALRQLRRRRLPPTVIRHGQDGDRLRLPKPRCLHSRQQHRGHRRIDDDHYLVGRQLVFVVPQQPVGRSRAVGVQGLRRKRHNASANEPGERLWQHVHDHWRQ